MSSRSRTCSVSWDSAGTRAGCSPKVTTSWSNGNSVTETLSYRYGNRSGWQIGEQIDGMEIVVKSSDSGEKRYVLTFDGM